MANKKFSEFELKTTTSNVSHIVGYNGAENVRITPANFLDTTGGPYLPLAGGRMVGNLITDDNVQIQVGSTGDLRIYHDGSNSYINDTGTGFLIIKTGTTGFLLQNSSGQNVIQTGGNEVFLRYGANTKLETTSTGISVTGNIIVGDSHFIGDDSFDNLVIQAGGTGNVENLVLSSSNDSIFYTGGTTPSVLGAERLRIYDSDGRAEFSGTVIATSDSNAKGVSILGRASDDISELNFYENDGTTLLSRLQTRTSYFFIGSITSIPMLFGIGGVEKMRLDASGNLGIGTSSPSTSLDILSTSSSPIRIIRNVNDSNVAINYTDTAGTNWYAGKSGLNHFSIGIAPNLSTNTFFNLTTAGNLGIGTSSPDALLHISQTSSNAQLIVERTGTATGKYQIYTNTNNLYFNNLASSSNPLTILDNNRIGMGNTTPDANLEISGDGASYPKLKLSNPSQTGRYLQIGMIDAVEHTIEANGGGTFLTFKTDATEKMRLTSVGELLKGTTAAVGQGTLADLNSTEIGNGYINLCRDDTANIKQIRFGKNGGEVGSISTGASATAYNTNSDYRLKEDLQDFEGLEMVSKIPVYDYKWKADESRSYGVMAHQLQEVLPQAVSGDKDAEEMQSVDYSKIVPLLVKSIQELKAEIELLKNK